METHVKQNNYIFYLVGTIILLILSILPFILYRSYFADVALVLSLFAQKQKSSPINLILSVLSICVILYYIFEFSLPALLMGIGGL